MTSERYQGKFHPFARARARRLSRQAVDASVEMGPKDILSAETRRTLNAFAENTDRLVASLEELHATVEENDRYLRTDVPDPNAQPTLFEEGELTNGKDF